jgi:hypothetical protein
MDNYGVKAKTNYKSQPLIHKQMQSLSEYTKLSIICSDHLTWKIKNHENQEEQEDQLHDYQDIRSTYHTTLQAKPCRLVFGRDMIHNIAFRVNWG